MNNLMIPADILESVSRDSENRSIIITPIKVIEYHANGRELEDQIAWPGTVTVIMAADGSPLLKRIRRTVTKRDGSDKRLVTELRAQSKGRRTMALEKAAETLIEQEVLADVRYGGSTVARGLFVPKDASYCAAVLPYNGGRLARQGFTLVTRYREMSKRRFEAIALKHSPPLSPAEKAALAKVPRDQLELNVGSIPMCWALSAVAVAALVTLLAVCTYKATEFQDGLSRHIPEEKVRELGPAATARQLMQLRRDVMKA